MLVGMQLALRILPLHQPPTLAPIQQQMDFDPYPPPMCLCPYGDVLRRRQHQAVSYAYPDLSHV